MKLIDTFRPVLYINGLFLIILSVGMIAPLVVDFAADNTDWQVFLVSALAAFLCGTLLATSQAGHIDEINLKQAFLLTTTSWLTLALFAALPFRFSTLELSMADAFFEAMSGLTTTGSTVLSGLDNMAPGILLWRAILHMMGGIGIIVMAITILPFLRSGGMQLFRTESSGGTDERVVPRVKRMTLGLMLIYGGLTIICGIALWLAGMTPFDAAVHAMATIPTGGFSSHDASIGFFHSPLIENLITLFMISGAFPFIAYLRTVHGQFSAIPTDPQVRGLLLVLLTTTLILTLWLVFTGQYAPGDAVRLAAFNITSVITTTGFASADYSLWGSLPLGVFMLITFVGGCTGSTSGGIKILRFQILKKAFNGYLQRLVYPHVIRPATIGTSRITPDVVMGVLVFIIVYCLTTGFFTLLLTALGLDLVTAFTGAATAISNVGPGLGAIVGPAGNFQPLSDGAKWVLAIAMLLGRLEFFTVLVLFTPAYWRS
ncbi:MAG: TrkH family potassium uptake protein [Rhodospirillales bacterium]|nr:TrkH family potassium uptake protein [Rhodospirillales bacterium]